MMKLIRPKFNIIINVLNVAQNYLFFVATVHYALRGKILLQTCFYAIFTQFNARELLGYKNKSATLALGLKNVNATLAI